MIVVKYIKKYWLVLLTLLVVAILALRIYDRFIKPKPPVPEVKNPVVDIYTLGTMLDQTIAMSCEVEPVNDITITAETSGSVTKVAVDEGDRVAIGDTLFELENIQERVSLADARVALQSAELRFQEILNDNNDSSASSLLSQTEAQQDALVESALNNLFNNDLRAYPEENPERADESAPTIIGNYTCEREGEYVVEVYSSGSKSGASFRYSGLESGTDTVSTTDFGTLLGSCGLELVFPSDFDKTETWVIPVPNTRSTSYINAQKAYETALETRNITLNQTGLSDQEIAQERGRVNQARLRYELAQDNFNKTIITAENAGVISGFDLDVGDYITAFSGVGNIKTVDQLELVAYLNPDEKDMLIKMLR